MVDAAALGAVSRVVLLARAGKAADNLAEAVRQAGAELVTVVDPASTDEASLRAFAPHAVLVALEPSIESSLDNLDALLIDPDLIVIFDEADVAAHRSGWDAARWARHLSAKLRRDGNVLPPGTESDTDWQPSPGKVPQPSAAYANVDLTLFTQEAVARADSVPSDGMPQDPAPAPVDVALSLDTALLDAIPVATAVVPPPMPKAPQAPAFEIESLDAAALELAALDLDAPAQSSPAQQTSAIPARTPPADLPAFEHLSLEALSVDDAPAPVAKPDAIAFESAEYESMTLESVSLDTVSLETPMPASAPPSRESSALDDRDLADLTFESIRIDDIENEGHVPESAGGSVAPMQLDDDAFFLEELSASGTKTQDTEHTPIRFDSGFEFDLPGDDDAMNAGPARTLPREPETVISFEELIANSRIASDVAAPAPPAAVPPPLPPAPAPADSNKTFSLGALSLAPVDDDAPPAAVEAAKPAAVAATSDLSALEARISSLSLVDLDEAAPKAAGMFGIQAAGVVLIEAGLGGPDPARQLLSAIPAEFPAIVLVRLHLQGGRYDRLVAQMERASALPVALAESGASANPGTIYFMPEGLSVVPLGAKMRFVAEESGPGGIFAALPANNSAVVFLSGSDPKLVDVAMAAAATGTMIAAQTPEDCYDGVACAELRTRGVASGLPAELAGRLASRWPS